MKEKMIVSSIVFLLSFQLIYAQMIPEGDKLNRKEKKELNVLWRNLKKVVAAKDLNKAKQYFVFPFYCSLCTTDSVGTNSMIEENNFEYFFSKYLLSANFKEILKTKSIHNILLISNEDGNSYLKISFPIIKPKNGREGIQGFLDIEKKANKFYFTSAWSVP